jgi:hypothetical protein
VSDAVELVFKALVIAGTVEPVALLKQEAARRGQGFVNMLGPNKLDQTAGACPVSSARAMYWQVPCITFAISY